MRNATRGGEGSAHLVLSLQSSIWTTPTSRSQRAVFYPTLAKERKPRRVKSQSRGQHVAGGSAGDFQAKL